MLYPQDARVNIDSLTARQREERDRNDAARDEQAALLAKPGSTLTLNDIERMTSDTWKRKTATDPYAAPRYDELLEIQAEERAERQRRGL